MDCATPIPVIAAQATFSLLGHLLGGVAGAPQAAAVGTFVLLGLVQPWSLLQHPCKIDTSRQTVAIIIPVK